MKVGQGSLWHLGQGVEHVVIVPGSHADGESAHGSQNVPLRLDQKQPERNESKDQVRSRLIKTNLPFVMCSGPTTNNMPCFKFV